MRSLVEAWFGPIRPRPGGTRWYGSSADLGEHSLIGWDGHGDNAGTVYVSLAGSDLASLGAERQRYLVAAMRGMIGFRASRADLYVDAWADLSPRPSAIRGHVIAGRVLSRILGDGDFRSDRRGWETLYLGARTSNVYGRIYEKGPDPTPARGTEARQRQQGAKPPEGQSDDGPARVRWELEVKGTDHPSKILDEWLAAESAPAATAVVWSWWRRLADFRDRRQGEAHGERRPLLDWWAHLVGSADRASWSVGHVLAPLVERAQWFERTLARTFATMRVGLGEAWASALLSTGVERMSARDWWEVDGVRQLQMAGGG